MLTEPAGLGISNSRDRVAGVKEKTPLGSAAGLKSLTFGKGAYPIFATDHARSLRAPLTDIFLSSFCKKNVSSFR